MDLRVAREAKAHWCFSSSSGNDDELPQRETLTTSNYECVITFSCEQTLRVKLVNEAKPLLSSPLQTRTKIQQREWSSFSFIRDEQKSELLASGPSLWGGDQRDPGWFCRRSDEFRWKGAVGALQPGVQVDIWQRARTWRSAPTLLRIPSRLPASERERRRASSSAHI